MQNKLKTLISSVFISFLLIGCVSPSKKLARAQAAIDLTKNKIEKNETSTYKAGISYVFAADYALSLDPAPSKFNSVAKDFTSRSLVITGPPAYQEALVFKQIVDGLLSTNLANQKRAADELRQKDQEIISLQYQNKELNQKLETVQQREEAVAKSAASQANIIFYIKRVLFIIAGVFVLGFIFHVLSICIPPPYGSIFGIVSLFFGGVIKVIKSLFPEAKKFGGVVEKVAHDKSEAALTSVVSAISDLKDKSPEVYDKVTPFLDKAGTVETAQKVLDIKKTLL